ncbi:hypothetical protein MRX96_024996 [Rhipicephalus microplus]
MVVAILVSASARLTNGADLRRRKILLVRRAQSSQSGLAVSVGLTNCAPVAPALIDEGARRWMGASNCTLPRTGRSRLSRGCYAESSNLFNAKAALRCSGTRETERKEANVPMGSSRAV